MFVQSVLLKRVDVRGYLALVVKYINVQLRQKTYNVPVERPEAHLRPMHCDNYF